MQPAGVTAVRHTSLATYDFCGAATSAEPRRPEFCTASDRRSLHITIASSQPEAPEMEHELWRAEADGSFSAEFNGFRMVVQALNATRVDDIRFLVLRQRDEPILVGSGIKYGWQAAMRAAEQMVDRCSRSRRSADLKSS